MPAQAGIQVLELLVSRFRGNDNQVIIQSFLNFGGHHAAFGSMVSESGASWPEASA